MRLEVWCWLGLWGDGGRGTGTGTGTRPRLYQSCCLYVGGEKRGGPAKLRLLMKQTGPG